MTPQDTTAQYQPVSDQPTAETPTPETDSERQRIPMIGKKYGFLTVVSEAPKSITPSGQTQLRYNCLCDCGNKTISIGGDLRSGRSKSCGCVRRKYQAPYCNHIRDTPETDAQPPYARLMGAVRRDFARTLERQRDAARAELERVKQALGIAERAMTHAGDDLAQLRADLAAAREERDATPETFRQAAYMLLATACVVVEIRDSANEARRRAKGHCCDFRSAIDAIYDKAEIELKHLREVGKQYHTWELKEIDRLTARAVEAERARGLEVNQLLVELDAWWSFDNNQQHTHSYHSKCEFMQKWRDKLSPAIEKAACGKWADHAAAQINGSYNAAVQSGKLPKVP